MNFLIVYSRENSSKKDSLEKFLEKNGSSVINLASDGDSKSDFKEIYSELKNITHCILLDEKSLERKFSFVLGYLLGSGTELFAPESEWTEFSPDSSNLHVFDSLSSLEEYIKGSLKAVSADFTKKAAWKKLFETGNPYTADSFALHIEKDNRDIVQTYLDAGMTFAERTSLGTPMLNVAIRAEQTDEAKWILTHELDLDAVSEDRGYSALMDCVWKKNLELAEVFVKKGVNLNFVSTDNQSALVLAVGGGDEKMVRLLAEAGADPDKKDSLGMTAYSYAKLFKRDDLVKILEKYHHEE